MPAFAYEVPHTDGGDSHLARQHAPHPSLGRSEAAALPSVALRPPVRSRNYYSLRLTFGVRNFTHSRHASGPEFAAPQDARVITTKSTGPV